MGTDIRILVVDDEPNVRTSLERWFSDEGCTVETAASGKEALAKVAAAEWDVFVLDIRMPGMDGLELQRRIREAHPDAAIIVMTAYASVETAVQALKQGAHDYVTKPFDPEVLERMVRSAVEKRRLAKENVLLKRSVEELERPCEIVGRSPAIEEIRRTVDTVAATDVAVLITGENGTGKEFVARVIHARSRRRYMPFVVFPCAGLPEPVVESELFGYEKAAFAEAQYRRKGKLELASGGTLFFEEVGALSPRIQSSLLRVLEERAISRIGGSARIELDFRTIAAASSDLAPAVAEHRFNEDLYYRLSLFPIRLPPLRERREDIALLAEHFLKRYARTMNRPLEGFSPAAMRMLVEHDWPRNVRELENAVERAAVVRAAGLVQPEDLPFGSGQQGGAGRCREPDKAEIRKVLEATGWNVSEAACLLDIDRVELAEKLRAYGIERP